MSPSQEDLHPAQNRGFRELYAAARLVVDHYGRLGATIDDPALGEQPRDLILGAHSNRIRCGSSRRRMTFAGTPAATTFGGTSLFTTA